MCLSCFGFLGFQGAPVPNPSVFKVLTPKISNFPDRSWNFGCLFWGSVFGAFLGLPLGGFLGAFWGPWGRLGGSLGRLGSPLGGLGVALGRLGSPFGRHWGLLGAFLASFGQLLGSKVVPYVFTLLPKASPDRFLSIFCIFLA